MMFFMIQRPPKSTRTDSLFPYTTRFLSMLRHDEHGAGGGEAVDAHDHSVAVGLPEPHQAEAQHVVGDESVLGDARIWNALGGVERDLAGHGLLLSACMLLHSAIIAAAMCSASAAMVRDRQSVV